MIDAQRWYRRLLGGFLLLSVLPVAQAAEEAPLIDGASTGPDVTVFSLYDTQNYGLSNGKRGYSIGTRSCNIGTAPLNWCDNAGGCGAGTTPQEHPVIAQNMYRLKDGRFNQIGASWLKHGFLSTNSNTAGCGTGSCQTPPLGSDQLGVGCTDPYGSSLNGSRPLGRKSEVNAATGVFPFPYGGGGASSESWNQRVAVAQDDLVAASNPGARYFIEGHYIASDDAAAGNGLNNASWREVTVSQSTFNLTLSGSTVREQVAIQAWPTIDPTVELVNVDVPGTDPVERYHVARKVTEVSPGLWHYEYAVHNMNSDRAADRMTVTFFGATNFSGIGFSDVDAHSNEPYDTTDWPATTSANSIEWAAPPFPSSPSDANALRWATMYNFWFDADRPPSEIGMHDLGIFSGPVSEVRFLENSDVLLEDGFETLVP
ncbi:MAG: hypothetical protein R3F15_10895 [Lysobacterales bacterium]